MSKRYDLLDELKECFDKCSELQNCELDWVGELLDEMRWYYKRKDLDLDTGFAVLFERLYAKNTNDGNAAPIVYDDIAHEFGMTTRTLDRRRRNFDKYFLKLILFEQKEQELAAWLKNRELGLPV